MFLMDLRDDWIDRFSCSVMSATDLGVRVFSALRKLHLRLKYPGISIDSSTIIGGRCEIICANGAHLQLKRCSLGEGVILRAVHRAHLRLVGVTVEDGTVIIAAERIEVEDARVGRSAVIRDHDHVFGDGVPLKDSGFKSDPVRICAGTRIGHRASVLKGVQIGADAVVLPDAVVTKSVGTGRTVAGVPAKPVVETSG